MQPLLNIDKVVKEKAPSVYHKVPKVLLRFAAWLICQEDMNKCLVELDNLKGPEFAEGFSKMLDVKYDVCGMDNIPYEGSFIFVSNHPLGAFDGISYINILGHRYPKFKVIVNDILMNIHNLRSNFLPVNTLGKQKREDMMAATDAYHDPETQVMSFPAGFCSRFIDGKIQDIPWRESVIKQAIATERDIIPMHFEGKNSFWFYFLEWFRRKMGMKFNIGLILLPRQMMRTAKGKTYRIIIGKPIKWQTFLDSSKTKREWAQWLRNECYNL